MALVTRPRPASMVCLVPLLIALLPAAASADSFVVTPAKVVLRGNLDRAQLVLTATDANGATNSRSEDLTTKAEYKSAQPEIVTVSPAGALLAQTNGHAVIAVTVGGETRNVEVDVEGIVPEPAVGFTEQVLPILSKAGCNSGACHASQYGKGGFILSVFGFAPDQDRAMIVRDSQQRRVNPLEPEESLLLRKPTMQIPHGGGKRLDPKSVDYQMLAHWVRSGAAGPTKDSLHVARVEVFPNVRVGEVGFRQQLRVVATFSDNSTRDVTCWAKFDSMDDAVAAATANGMITAAGRGQAPVMVRFEGQAEICTVVVPYPQAADLAGWTENNYIDKFAADKFRELGLTPSALCDDATFIRRAYLDALGAIPTPAAVTAFIDSADPDKRRKLIDELLGLTGDPARDIHNDQYAAYWTLKWSDLIRADSRELGEQGMWALHNWIKGQFRVNRPFDQFVRELVTAKGSIFSNGPANYFRIANNPSDLAESTAQLFLGVRLQCAKCHHHPFEKYSQDDYYGFAAFFSRVGTKTSQEFGLFGGETVVMVKSGGEVAHPRTGKRMEPTPLEGQAIDDPLDRRTPLAQWLTARENRFFSRNVVNRYMGYLLGRGLVEPIDDMRATNPPSNVPLMDALSDDLVQHNFDLKHLLRTIMNSRLYQLDSQPLAANAADTRFYSHYKVKRISAEPLLDAVDAVAGTQTKYKDLPLGTHAVELPDAEYPDYFLNTFAKPKRASVCECERSPDENLAQALHTLNGDIIFNKIAAPTGRIATLLKEQRAHEDIVTEVYLAALGRRPSEVEMATSRTHLANSPSPKEYYEDLMWALMNTKQFLFVR